MYYSLVHSESGQCVALLNTQCDSQFAVKYLCCQSRVKLLYWVIYLLQNWILFSYSDGFQKIPSFFIHSNNLDALNFLIELHCHVFNHFDKTAFSCNVIKKRARYANSEWKTVYYLVVVFPVYGMGNIRGQGFCMKFSVRIVQCAMWDFRHTRCIGKRTWNQLCERAHSLQIYLFYVKVMLEDNSNVSKLKRLLKSRRFRWISDKKLLRNVWRKIQDCSEIIYRVRKRLNLLFTFPRVLMLIAVGKSFQRKDNFFLIIFLYS